MPSCKALLLTCIGIACLCRAYGDKDGSLSAKEVLKTISPDYHTPKLPPGFPSLEEIQTNLFNYKTDEGLDRVSATLATPVVMYPHYVHLMKVGLNFTYNKTGAENGTWDVDVKGTWPIGSTLLPVHVSSRGEVTGEAKTMSLDDLISAFLNKNENIDIGLDTTAIVLNNVKVRAVISRKMSGVKAIFSGTLDLKTIKPTKINITLVKNNISRVQLYSIMRFRHVKAKKILKDILNQKILTTPFFAHMLTSGDLFARKKNSIAIAFSFNEVYHYRERSMAGHIIRSVLQSHIPAGITLLSHIKIKANKNSPSRRKRSKLHSKYYVKVAFVINQPAFDLLLSQDDKILVSELLPALSEELSSTDHMQRFNRSLRDAYTTHVSFDSLSTVFSIFVRLRETIELSSPSLRINVTNLALQKNIGLDDNKVGWKVSAKGVYSIGGQRVRVKYSELTDDPGESFGLTGSAHELTLESILKEFKPVFYPSDEVKTMVENTEVGSLKLYKVKIYSRGSDPNATPHLLITGLSNLPQWEKEIQVALLLLYKNNTWMCKWAASLKNSPLSNILQALTGFDTRNVKILHNNHIITTIISSPLPPYSMLPSYIITTRLLRLPVQRALTVVALLPFPDNCGDDKMCESAAGLLDTSKVYTVSGVLSMNEYVLRARLSHIVNISDALVGENNTLQFSISNNSRMEINTSFKLPGTDYVFDGTLDIDQSGLIEIDAGSRKKEWVSPFGMNSITFEDMKLNTVYRKKKPLSKLNMFGTIKLGLHGFQDKRSLAKVGLKYYGRPVVSDIALTYDVHNPVKSKFFANFSDITIPRLLGAFFIDVSLPNILYNTFFPQGLVVSHGGEVPFQSINSPIKLEGFINIFGRLLNCSATIIEDPRTVNIITENSPAPLLFAKGEIIIQKDSQTSLQGPQVVASIDTREANVSIRGYVKILGIESDVDISIVDNVKFTVTGKLMDYKDTSLTAYSMDTLEQFQVYGCLRDVAFQVQLLLIEIITKSANQSVVNKRKAESNYLNAQNYNEVSEHEELILRTRRDHDRAKYEEQLLDYGRFEVKVNDTCVVPGCEMKCFGCPRLEKCCRLDIFGHCIACSSWKPCCWKNVNPLCISKQDGCDVIRTAAQRMLAEKEDQILQERIELDNLELHVLKAEVNKGKHEAVLEAAIDAKQLVEEDSSPGLNAHDAIKNFGPTHTWARINSVCYNTSIEQAATGCMKFIISAQLFKMDEQNLTIWSCLKDDLVTELAESLANLIFPNIVDTSDDSITEVAEKLNGAKVEHHYNQVGPHHPTVNGPSLGVAPSNMPTVKVHPPSKQQHKNPSGAAKEPPSIAHTKYPSVNLGGAKEPPSIAHKYPSLNPSANPAAEQLSDKVQVSPVDLDLNIDVGNDDLQKLPPTKPNKPTTYKPTAMEEEKLTDVFHAGSALTNGGPSTQQVVKPHVGPVKNQHAGPRPGPQVKISEPKVVDGFMPYSGSDADGGSAQGDKELKEVYDNVVKSGGENSNGERISKQEDNTFEDGVNAPKQRQSTREATADEILEDEEREEEKGVKDAVAEADRDMSRIVQNETDLMLKYQFNPHSHRHDSLGYVIEEPVPHAFFYESRNNQTNHGGIDYETDTEIGEDPMHFTNEYPLEDALKQDTEFAPQNSRLRKKRELQDIKKMDSFDIEHDLMEEARFISPHSASVETDPRDTEAGLNRARRDNDLEEVDLMSESMKVEAEKAKEEEALHRSRRSVTDDEKIPEDAPKTDGELSPDEVPKIKNGDEVIEKRLKRDLPDDENIPDEVLSQRDRDLATEDAPKVKNGDEIIEKRLKRDLSALYDLEEYDDPEYMDLDEVFKRKLNEQHEHRDKRSQGLDLGIPSPFSNRIVDTSKRMLFSKPFWDVRPDRRRVLNHRMAESVPSPADVDGKKKSNIGGPRHGEHMMNNMLKKRWKIPANSNGRCHIYHQLIAICKDMADTIVTLDKSLNRSRAKFLAEDKDVYLELFDTEEYLVNAAKKINISAALTKEAEKTLTGVQQGVNIWSRRCTSEFDWQNKSGVQTWIQAMDLKIQELGGFGVYRFLENLFHAFQALFEVLTLGNTDAARDAIDLLHRTHSISKSFDRIFKDKLSVAHSRVFANDILVELEHLKKDSLFC